jgi:ribonuclease HI
MELVAYVKGISAMLQLGINNIILEMDVQQVVGALQGDELRLSLVEALCI